ncbi:DNA polymerase III subunit alpha [Pelagibacterales bacterium]|nr:DNA polymerase III subunit alpha [Pelagibacterales bacterium]
MNDFIHLNTKSDYSLSEGALTIQKIADLCADNNMPAIAVTDNNNLFGALEFSETISKAGIQPIIGAKIRIKTPNQYVIDPENDSNNYFCINLLSKNDRGYENLLYLNSISYTQHSSDNAFITLEQLFTHKEGLILLTGGYENIFNNLLFHNKYDWANSLLNNIKDEFNSNMYIEIQRIGDPVQIQSEKLLLKLSYQNEIPLVATNEVCFENPDYYNAHEALLCIDKKEYLSQANRQKFPKETYFKSSEEMLETFIDLPEAIQNTIEIAKRCSSRPQPKEPTLPNFSTKDKSENDILIEDAKKGLQRRLEFKFNIESIVESKDEISKNYHDRLQKELDIIINMKYSGYFLIVADFIKWSKNNKIPVGPGRGSGAGSLVAWVLDITDIDPIKFGLIFERFLNPERVSMPDLDIDFCRDRRDEVLDYVSKKYGENQVAQIITFGKLQARAVLRDVGRVLGIPYGQVDYLCKLIPFDPSRPLTLQESIDNEPKISEEANNDEKVEKLLDIALRLEGLKRHTSIHAAGVVISKDEIFKDVPLYSDPDTKTYLTQFDMKHVEKAGLVKFDFLGLKTLTLIDNCVQLITNQGIDFDINKIDLTDLKTFDFLSSGETTGIFQLESPGMQETLRQMTPDALEDIIALVALYRPGPMQNIPTYIERKHGREKPEYLHPRLENILKETYGVIVYQEQVMGVARELSGYSDGEADLLRRAMGKKIQKEMKDQRKRFVSGCIENGIKDNEAQNIFDLLAKFADYGFNKSHAAAYGLISFQTAYLKTHYPLEFFAASMTLDINNTDKLATFQQELSRMKIKLYSPNINTSDVYFVTDDNGIKYALGAIKNVGIESMKELIEERNKGGLFSSFNNFLGRVSGSIANKKTLEALACAGVFDELGIKREDIFNQSNEIVKAIKDFNIKTDSNQGDIFGNTGSFEFDFLKTEKWSEATKLIKEFQIVGFYFSGHPLAAYTNNLINNNVREYMTILKSKEIQNSKNILVAGTLLAKKEKRSARGNAYAFLNFSDTSSIYEGIIFEANLRKYRDMLIVGQSYVVGADFTEDNGQTRVEIKKVYNLDDIVKFNENSPSKPLNKKIKIVTNSIQAVQAIKEMEIVEGEGTILLIFDGKTIKIGEKFLINDILIEKLRNIPEIESVELC